jgi:hypothetical protein
MKMMSMEYSWNDTDKRKPKYAGKVCPIATVAATYLSWTGLGLNPGD